MGLVRTKISLGLAAALVGVGLFFAFRGGMPTAPGGDGSGASHTDSVLMISPDVVDFGDLAVGVRDERAIILTNTSDRMLFVSRIEAPDGFVIVPDSIELAAGDSRAVTLQFAPTEAVSVVDAPLIFSTVEHAPQIVPVNALVVGSAQINVEPLSLSFGRVKIDGSAQASLRIENRGDEMLTITGLATSQPFSVLGGEAELAAGDSTEITVGFNPENAGPFEGQLSIKSSDESVRTIVVSLKGNGALEEQDAVLSAATETLEFGAVPVGGSATRYLELTNTGRDSLMISRIAVDPPCDAPKVGWQISPGSTYRVGFRFRPTRAGAALCPVTIYSNDPHNGALVVTTVGEGKTEGQGPIAGLNDDPNGPEGSAPTVKRSGSDPSVAQGGSDSDGGQQLSVASSDRPSSEAPSEELENPRAAESDEPDFAPVGVSVADGSRMYIGTQSSEISVYDVPGLNYDADAGTVSGDGIVPPPIDFALGDNFRVEIGAFNLTVNDIGHVEPTTVPVTMYDKFDNPYYFDATITTESAAAITPDGLLSVKQGAPMTSDSPMLIMNVPTPRDGPTAGIPLSFELGLLGVNG